MKVALVAPAGTVALEGTLATAVLLLESVTWSPPARSGSPCPCTPPTTLVGFSASEETIGSTMMLNALV